MEPARASGIAGGMAVTSFSIVVPVYNVATYLGPCIDSILLQRRPNVEIILVDDCSSDGSAEICDRYVRDHDAIRVIHFSQNRGVAMARNAGVDASTGDYIIFLDSDDCLV